MEERDREREGGRDAKGRGKLNKLKQRNGIASRVTTNFIPYAGCVKKLRPVGNKLILLVVNILFPGVCLG